MHGFIKCVSFSLPLSLSPPQHSLIWGSSGGNGIHESRECCKLLMRLKFIPITVDWVCAGTCVKWVCAVPRLIRFWVTLAERARVRTGALHAVWTILTQTAHLLRFLTFLSLTLLRMTSIEMFCSTLQLSGESKRERGKQRRWWWWWWLETWGEQRRCVISGGRKAARPRSFSSSLSYFKGEEPRQEPHTLYPPTVNIGTADSSLRLIIPRPPPPCRTRRRLH